MPIIIVEAVPIIAVAPPEIGSHGPSSVSYSRGRNLFLLALVDYCDILYPQFKFTEIELAFLS